MPIHQRPWLLLKLFFVFLLFLYHLGCHKIYKQFQNNEIKYTSTKLRIWNEVATLLLFAIVFLVVLKSLVSVGWGIMALISLGAIMSLFIKIYKKVRES